ncbi:MAG: hypothetical protein ACYDAC_07700 [Candidatus Dormibacteria bacterium]
MASLRRNAWVLVAAVAALVLTVQPFRDTDVWWHLAVGRLILAHGIPSTEPFSFLHAANPWVGQQWLYEVTIARLVSAGGPGLASLVLGLAGCGAFLISTLSIPRVRRPAGPWMAAALLLSCLVAAQLLGVRGQVVTLLGTAVVLYVIARWRQGARRVLYALPPVLALWANLHAGFITGLAIMALALLVVRDVDAASRRSLAIALVASLVATLLNPAGPRLWGYVISTFDNPTLTSLATEWMSPDFHNLFLRIFEVNVVLLLVAWFLAPRRDAFDVILATLAFVASLAAQRNVSLFALVASPQLAAYGSAAWQAHRHRLPRPWPPRLGRRGPAPLWFSASAAAVVIAATAGALAPQLTATAAASYERTHEPESAATWVAVHQPGQRVFSTDTMGGYLAYRFPAGRVVYLYDETAIFGDAALRRYLTVAELQPGWPALFTTGGVSVAVLPGTAPQVAALLTLGWRPACRDVASGTVVLVADPAATGAGGALSTDPTSLAAAPACGS